MDAAFAERRAYEAVARRLALHMKDHGSTLRHLDHGIGRSQQRLREHG